MADIHFDYRLAIACCEGGAAKIRINPGNIGGPERVRAVADACRERHIPIRIGVNGGSLKKELLEKYGHPTAEALVESAFSHIHLLEDCGVTETGARQMGVVKSAMGIGGLLCMGIGDTLRVSLTADPVEEVKLARQILQAAELRQEGVNIVSCPTCGRTQIDLIDLVNQVEQKLKDCKKPITVAVMGCVVNGPGEAREADVGIAGGDGCGYLFVKGVPKCKVPAERMLDELLALIDTL